MGCSSGSRRQKHKCELKMVNITQQLCNINKWCVCVCTTSAAKPRKQHQAYAWYQAGNAGASPASLRLSAVPIDNVRSSKNLAARLAAA
jgi:hypothetical protein